MIHRSHCAPERFRLGCCSGFGSPSDSPWVLLHCWAHCSSIRSADTEMAILLRMQSFMQASSAAADVPGMGGGVSSPWGVGAGLVPLAHPSHIHTPITIIRRLHAHRCFLSREGRGWARSRWVRLGCEDGFFPDPARWIGLPRVQVTDWKTEGG